jgi:ParB family chromosome partitioning protein
MPEQDTSRLDYVALSDIYYNPAINARRDTETDVGELAATIDVQDLGQPLLLRPSERGYEPVDGGRRLRAMKSLAESGKLPHDHPVPAYIRELDDAEAMSLSLATVITRMDLHPADEALDFTDLVSQGMTPDHIAARFGIPLRRVRQRLAIGKLPKEIVAGLKAGEIGLEDAQAYTLLPDPAQALKLWKQGVRESWQIKKEFSKARIAADAPEAAYVGIDAYRAAGGAVDEDLFSNNAWLADGKLLNKLFQQKLKADEKAWLDEGWGFVILEMDKAHTHKTRRWPWLKPEGKRSLSKEQKARADALKAEIKRLDAEWRKTEDSEAEEQLQDKIIAAKAELEQLAGNFFTDAQKKKSGVVVRREYSEITVTCGMMKPAAAKKEAKLSKQTASGGEGDSSPVRKVEPEAEADFTGALQAEMATAMTHAMQWSILAAPAKALRLAAAMLMNLSEFAKPEGFILDAPQRRLSDIGKDVAAAHAEMMDKLQHDPHSCAIVEVFDALHGSEILDQAIALSIAPLLKYDAAMLEALRPIIDAFDPDVAAHWLPDAEFYKRMPRESLAAALGEAAIAGVTPSKKKKDLVEMAVRELTPKAWLPKPLRTPSYKGPGSNAWADAAAAAAVGDQQDDEAA